MCQRAKLLGSCGSSLAKHSAAVVLPSKNGIAPTGRPVPPAPLGAGRVRLCIASRFQVVPPLLPKPPELAPHQPGTTSHKFWSRFSHVCFSLTISLLLRPAAGETFYIAVTQRRQDPRPLRLQTRETTFTEFPSADKVKASGFQERNKAARLGSFDSDQPGQRLKYGL